MKNFLIKSSYTVSAALLAAPAFAGAAGILDSIGVVNRILKAVVPMLITIALIVFIWGLIKYLLKIGDEKERQAGIQLMLYGVVAIFVMSSVWGLVRLLQNTFSVQQNTAIVPNAPDIGTYRY
ncbi:MAG: hypothetical protein AAB421_02510 [Patescibacteria group bacterium]